MDAVTSCEYEDGVTGALLNLLRTQVFIILHRWGFVGWHVQKIDKGAFPWISLGSTGFHEIIGYDYREPDSGSSSNETVVRELRLARGIFHSQSFRRVIIYVADSTHAYQLPYNPLHPQPGDEGYTAAGPGTGQVTYAQASYSNVSYSQY